MEVMSRLGLSLPSEAQWENGARGGRDSPFWTGSTTDSLRGAANLADAYGRSHGNEALSPFEKDLDDGSSVHAEIGSYRANPFGLHDVIGNVWEWCLDGYDPRFYGCSPEADPVAPSADAAMRVLRGGGFVSPAVFARSAYRSTYTAEYQDNDVGLRPAWAVTRPASQVQSVGR